MSAVMPQDTRTPDRKPGRRASLVGALVVLAAGLTLAEPALAQFGLNLGGFGIGGGRGGYGGGSRPGYGMGGARPGYGMGGTRPGYGMGGARPGYGMGGNRPGYGMGGTRPGYGMGGSRPGYGMGGTRPGNGMNAGGYGKSDGGMRPPGGTRPPYGGGHATRPPRYPTRPPVVGRPHMPPWQVRPVRLRPPVMVAQPPAAMPPPPRMLGPGGPVGPSGPVGPRGPVAPPLSGPPPVAQGPTPPRGAPDRSFVDREVLVEVAGGQSADAIRRIATQNGLTLLGSTELALAGTSVHRFRISGRRSVDSVVDALGRDGRVAFAQRNHLYRLQVDAGQAYYPLASRQYAVGKLRLSDAHRMATGEGVTVAVIDSGIDTGHPDLQGAIGASENTLSSAAKPDMHGTAIAGAIAARGQLLGVAPRTSIVAIRAFAPATKRAGAEGTSWDIVRAMELAAKAGARVVNLSFAGPADRLMLREIGGGLQRGMVFVAAAGNAGAGAPPAYPAANPGVIAVTATDLGDQVYASANRGSYVTVAAPGVDVLVATPNAGYDMSSGTSVAAAHVSGIVALMLQREPNLTPDAIRSTLVARAKDLGAAGPDPEYGAGLVDAFAALAAPEPPPVPVATAPSQPSVLPVAHTPAGSPPPAPALASGPAGSQPPHGSQPPLGSQPPPPPGPAPVAVMPPGPPPIAPMGSPPPPPPMASADPVAPPPVAVAPAGTPPPPPDAKP